MKLRNIIFLVFIILLSAPVFANYAVEITPNPAYDEDDIVCNVLVTVNGESYFWYKNNELTTFSGNTISSNYTQIGDNWKCIVKKYYGYNIGWVTIGEDSVVISPSGIAQNTAPQVRIEQPRDNEIVLSNLPTYFWGTAIDKEDGILKGSSLVWSSNIDGIIGYGNFFYTTLSKGSHIITLEATDSKGLSSTYSIHITVIGGTENYVYITPKPAYNNSDLTCNIALNTNGMFFWYRNEEATTINTKKVSNIYTEVGDVWLCEVKKYFGSQVGWVSLGNDSVIILPDNQTNFTNHPPYIDIIKPENNSNYLYGSNITFEAYSYDVDGDEVNVEWFSNINGFLGTGNILVTDKLSEGTHVVYVVATDSHNSKSNDSVLINILPQNISNNAPQITILYPLNNSLFSLGQNILFFAIATDVEDGDLHSSIIWESSIDGIINIGNNFIYQNLSLGEHLITARVSDSKGVESYATTLIKIENITNVTNNAPNVKILLPQNNSNFVFNSPVVFEGIASDAEDGTNIYIEWESDIDGILGNSKILTLNNLSIGQHIITLRAKDTEGAVGVDKVVINVIYENYTNNAPSIDILRPQNNSIFGKNDYIYFEAQATDPEDGVLVGNSIIWNSNIDGNFGNGTTIWINKLSEGNHIITVTAKDSQGKTATDTIQITITYEGNFTNQPPVVDIIFPFNNSVYLNNTEITFYGIVTDPEQGMLGLNIEWYSNIDGYLGNSLLFSTNKLSVGTHIITLNATDSEGATASDSTVLYVSVENITNRDPEIEIITPSDLAVFRPGDYIWFNAQAVDPEDGVLVGNSIIWNSNIDGNFGNGTTIWINKLSEGNHIITVTAKDSQGKTATDTIRIFVTAYNITNNPPNVTIIAPLNGSKYPNGSVVFFLGEAIDYEEGIIVGDRLNWTIDDVFVFKGSSFSLSNLTIGNHTIKLTASDSWGLSNSASINIEVYSTQQNTTNETNTAPNVTIILPVNNSNFLSSQLIEFFGIVIDKEDNNVTNLLWFSDKDGVLGANTTHFNYSGLSQGTHVITFLATDSDGMQGHDSVLVNILNESGQNQTGQIWVSIESPQSRVYNITNIFVNITASEGAVITFSLDGSEEVNYPGAFTGVFGDGQHVLTAYARSKNETAITTVQFSVNSSTSQTKPQNGPRVILIAPGDRAFKKDSSVTFLFEVYKTQKDVEYCTLFLDNTEFFSFDNIVEGLNTINSFVPEGEHRWFIRCFDKEMNVGNSETRILSLGNLQFYQPPIREEAKKLSYEVSITNIEIGDIKEGEEFNIKINLENTGDFDLDDLNLGVSIYELDIYSNSKLSLKKGQKITKTFYFEAPPIIEQGYYDVKISLKNDKINRIIYKDIFIT